VHRHVLAFAMLVAATGCDLFSPTVNSVQLLFSLEAVDPEDESERVFVAVGGDGGIDVRGYFDAPCELPAPLGSAAREDEKLTLTVRFQADATCSTAPRRYTYQALLTGLTGGGYELRVRHEGEPERSGTIFERQVTVN